MDKRFTIDKEQKGKKSQTNKQTKKMLYKYRQVIKYEEEKKIYNRNVVLSEASHSKFN